MIKMSRWKWNQSFAHKCVTQSWFPSKICGKPMMFGVKEMCLSEIYMKVILLIYRAFFFFPATKGGSFSFFVQERNNSPTKTKHKTPFTHFNTSGKHTHSLRLWGLFRCEQRWRQCLLSLRQGIKHVRPRQRYVSLGLLLNPRVTWSPSLTSLIALTLLRFGTSPWKM